VGQWLDLLTLAGINGLSALGLYVQMRSGQMSVASGAFLGIGALACVRLTERGAPFEMGIVGGAAAAALIGAMIAYPCLRVRGLYLAIATLAFAEIMRVLSTNVEWFGGTLGLHNIPIRTTLWHVAVLVLFVGIWLYRHQRSVMGIRWDSSRESEAAAAMVGLNVHLHRVAAFAVGAGILGIGGALLVHYVGFLSPESYGYETGVEVLLFVVLGGMATVLHPLIGAVLVTMLLELLRPFAENRMLVYALILMVVTILRTRKVVGLSKRLPVWG